MNNSNRAGRTRAALNANRPVGAICRQVACLEPVYLYAFEEKPILSRAFLDSVRILQYCHANVLRLGKQSGMRI